MESSTLPSSMFVNSINACTPQSRMDRVTENIGKRPGSSPTGKRAGHGAPIAEKQDIRRFEFDDIHDGDELAFQDWRMRLLNAAVLQSPMTPWISSLESGVFAWIDAK